MESLDLLKSLTNGVNKKSETTLPSNEGKVEDEIIEYTVNTSLRGLKNKKTSIKEEEIVDYTENDYIEEDVEDTENMEIIEDYIVEDSESGVELIDSPLDIIDTTCEEKNEHKNEDSIVLKNKIDRQGNPFKRGPRKKKEEQKLISEDFLEEDTNSVEFLDLSGGSDLSLEEEDFEIESSETFESSELEDTLLDDDELIEGEDLFAETTFIAKSNTLDMDEILFDDDCFGDISDEELEEEEINLNKELEQDYRVSEEETEDLEDLEDIDNVEDIEETDIDTLEEIQEEDTKFKDCNYYKGMDIEEYLRSNPKYREALYVEHFYAKEYLNKLLNAGIILYGKGMYRL